MTNRYGIDPPDINVLSLVKGQERYLFTFTLDRTRALKQALGRLASNPELSFTWFDAWQLTAEVERITKESERSDVG